jgi:predicted nucleotidyltransferase
MGEFQIPARLHGTIARLVRALRAEAVILFGSRAKGAARPASDIDLLVIAPDSGNAEFQLRLARNLVAGSFPRIDIVLCTPDDVQQAKTGKSPFVQSALEAGITLYRQPGAGPEARIIPEA